MQFQRLLPPAGVPLAVLVAAAQDADSHPCFRRDGQSFRHFRPRVSQRFSVVARCEQPFPLQRRDIIRASFKDSFDSVYSASLSTPISAGAFGKVYICKHKELEVERACKVMPKASVMDMNLFRNEVEILMLLDHPNIIRLVRFFEEPDQVKLVFKLCQGQDMCDRAVKVIKQDGHFSNVEAAWALKHMLKALIGCHSKGVIHRDIKPENFMITKHSGKPGTAGLRLIDLGLAKYCHTPDALAQSDDHLGTLQYMAPEVLSGKYDHRCDIWSLGVLLYLLVVGKLLFPVTRNAKEARTVTANIQDPAYVQSKLAEISKESHPWVSDEAKDLMSKMLQFDSNKRISLEQALTHPFISNNYDKQKDIGVNSDNTCSKDGETQNALLESTDCLGDRLDTFARMTPLKRAALSIYAHLVPDEYTKNERRIFRRIDADYKGVLREDEIQSYISSKGGTLLKAGVYSKLDTDGSGDVAYTEFLAAVLPFEILTSRQWSHCVFNILDMDKDGYVTPTDLESLLNGRMDAATLRAVLVEGAGKDKLSFDDFCIMMA